MQQQLLLSLWLSQIAQGYRFSVAAPLLCLKPSYHMQHQILSGSPDRSLVAYCLRPYWTELNHAFYLPVQAGFGSPRYEISEVVFFGQWYSLCSTVTCSYSNLLQCGRFEYGCPLWARSGHKFYLTGLLVTVQQYPILNVIKIIGIKINTWFLWFHF